MSCSFYKRGKRGNKDLHLDTVQSSALRRCSIKVKCWRLQLTYVSRPCYLAKEIFSNIYMSRPCHLAKEIFSYIYVSHPPLGQRNFQLHLCEPPLLLNFGFRTNRFSNNLLERIIFDNRGLTVYSIVHCSRCHSEVRNTYPRIGFSLEELLFSLIFQAFWLVYYAVSISAAQFS